MIASFASAAVVFLAERSIAFAVVFLVLGAVWILARRFLSAELSSLWFLAPLVVLVLPLESWIPNPWEQSNPIESAVRAALPSGVERSLLDATTEGFLDFTNAPSAAATASPDAAASVTTAVAAPRFALTMPAPSTWLFAAWMLVILGLALRFWRGHRGLGTWLQQANALDPSDFGIDLADLQRRAGVAGQLVLLETPELESPAVDAGRTAAILLPEGLAGRLSRDELTWVLLHELAHLARRDHRTELVQRLFGAAFFFHPLVWASNRLVRAHRELACDDMALALMEAHERPRCARALFEVIAHATALSSRPGFQSRTPHAMASLFHSKKLLRTRIMRLVEPHRPLTRGLRATAFVALLLTSSAALAAARFPAFVAQDDALKIALSQEPEHVLEESHDGVQEDLDDIEEALNDVQDELEIMAHNESAGEFADSIRGAAQLATDWLVRNQAEDGAWHFVRPKKEAGNASEEPKPKWGELITGAKPSVRFEPLHTDMALTGMSLLALVRRAAVGPQDPAVRASIDKAVSYILAHQDKELGLFGTQEMWPFMIGHALATEGLARASIGHMTEAKKHALEEAVRFIESARNPYAAWRYSFPPMGENDARVTGSVMLALSAAFEAGLAASPETFASGMSFMLSMEDKESGRTGYMDDTEFALRLKGRHKSFPAERAEVPTAMHMRLRSLSGLRAPSEDVMRKAEGILLASVPTWDAEYGTIDYDYWWQGTEALASRGASGAEWTDWRTALLDALLKHEVKEGADAGTWPMIDAWSTPGLEAYASAANALSLYAILPFE